MDASKNVYIVQENEVGGLGFTTQCDIFLADLLQSTMARIVQGLFIHPFTAPSTSSLASESTISVVSEFEDNDAILLTHHITETVTINDETTPVNNETTPVNVETTPVNNETTPVNEDTTPEIRHPDDEGWYV